MTDYLAVSGVMSEVAIPIAVGVYIAKEIIGGVKTLRNGKNGNGNGDMPPRWFVKFQEKVYNVHERQVDILKDIRDELKKK